MDFTLKKEHEMARQLFKDFAQNEVKPLAQETDETEISFSILCSGLGTKYSEGTVPSNYR